jgi:hypothetical protein
VSEFAVTEGKNAKRRESNNAQLAKDVTGRAISAVKIGQ